MRSAQAILIVSILLPTCGRAPTPIKPEVPDTRLTRSEVETATRLWAHDPQRRQAAIDALAQEARLATAARQTGLHLRPDIRAEILQAERRILARAYRNAQIRPATTDFALRRQYETDPSRFDTAEIHVRQIAIHWHRHDDPHPNPRARLEARQRAERLYARLKSGHDFADLARRESDDPVTAAKGGDLGPIQSGAIDAAFFAAARELPAGAFSKPFETPYGLHIIQTVRVPRTIRPKFEAIRGRLSAQQRRRSEAALMSRLNRQITDDVIFSPSALALKETTP